MTAPRASWWTRGKAWFARLVTPRPGMRELPEAVGVTTVIAGEDAHERTCESVVRRARHGDQNAMALVALVRDRAREGHPLAVVSFRLMQAYVASHPVGDHGATFAGDAREAQDALASASVQASFERLWTPARLDALCARIAPSEDERAAFYSAFYGAEDPVASHPKMARAQTLGGLLRKACQWQVMRCATIPLAAVDSDVAWELGGES